MNNTTKFNPEVIKFLLTEDTHTKTNEKIFVAKATEKLTKEEYILLSKYIRNLGGYYSKFKHGFIFKDNPCDKIMVETADTETADETFKITNNKNSIYTVTKDGITLSLTKEEILSMYRYISDKSKDKPEAKETKDKDKTKAEKKVEATETKIKAEDKETETDYSQAICLLNETFKDCSVYYEAGVPRFNTEAGNVLLYKATAESKLPSYKRKLKSLFECYNVTTLEETKDIIILKVEYK